MKFMLSLLVAVCCAAAASALSARSVGKETGINWSIAQAPNGGYMVTLGKNDFPANHWIGMGFSLTPSMPQSFMITCVKAATGQVVVQSRYAYEHALPPLTAWGMQPVPSSQQNTCMAMIPAQLVNKQDPENPGVLAFGGPKQIYVLNAMGPLDASGQIQKHSKKELHPLTLA